MTRMEASAATTTNGISTEAGDGTSNLLPSDDRMDPISDSYHHQGSNNNSNSHNNSQYKKRRKRSLSSTSHHPHGRWEKDTTRIVIVGAGLAGLTAALALERAGFTNISLYERETYRHDQNDNDDHGNENYTNNHSIQTLPGDTTTTPSTNINITTTAVTNSTRRFVRNHKGYGLTLSYNPKGPLHQLGILEQVAQRDCPSRAHYVFLAPHGQLLGYYGHAFYTRTLSPPTPLLSHANHQNGDNHIRCGTTLSSSSSSSSSYICGHRQRGNLRIPRHELRQILLDHVQSPVIWNKRLRSVRQQHQEQHQEQQRHLDPKLELEFEDGTIVSNVDLLVGADGIRSRVVRSIRSSSQLNSSSSSSSSIQNNINHHPLAVENRKEEKDDLRYLGVVLILGIADFCHPLLDERGFYSLDGHHRLFTMPYQGSRLLSSQPTLPSAKGISTTIASEKEEEGGGGESNDNNNNNNIVDDHDDNMLRSPRPIPKRRVMWQLSFPMDNFTKAQQLTDGGHELLREEVSRRCHDWHEPVLSMIQATPLETIWGTPLMDRDPRKLYDLVRQSVFANHVVVLGDACHAMSPFKGQGANQALLDGPLLASWLQRANKRAAIQGFWREMVDRTALKVEASAQAAQRLHSQQVLLEEPNHFAGVRPDGIAQLLTILRQRRIGANHGAVLNQNIRTVIQELEIALPLATIIKPYQNQEEQNQIEQRALSLSTAGDTHALRNLSLQHASAIRNAVDSSGHCCLYLASREGHVPTCQWLLTEVFIPPDDDNFDDRLNDSVPIHICDALQVATCRGHLEIANLLSIALHLATKTSSSSSTTTTTTTTITVS